MSDLRPPTEQDLRDRLAADTEREHIEGDTWKWVKVSTEMLAELKQWSVPVQVRIHSEDEFGILEMEIRNWDPNWPGHRDE